jgi:hypothetical protein
MPDGTGDAGVVTGDECTGGPREAVSAGTSRASLFREHPAERAEERERTLSALVEELVYRTAWLLAATSVVLGVVTIVQPGGLG